MDEYNKLALKDLEITIHDARRKIEKLLDSDRAGQPLPQRELEGLASDLVQALKYFYDIRNGADKVVEELAAKATDNVVEIFPKKDR
jgi:hypothetical protein